MHTKMIFLVLPQIHLMDLAGPDQVFLEAIDYGANLSIEYCSTDENLITSAGLPLAPITHFNNIKVSANDFIFIPGCNIEYLLSKSNIKNNELHRWIRSCYENGTRLCSICSGAFILAQSGILDNKECTTHWKRTSQLQTLFPQLKVIENVLFVEDKNIFTSAGIASGIDMALYILEILCGDYMAHKVAREMVIYNRRKGHSAQKSVYLDYRNHIHVGIHKVQDWLQEHLDKKTNLNELAEIACMSGRNFTRIFKKETGITVNEYIRLLRLEKINQLLNQPDTTRSQIAKACGLKSERHITRLIQISQN